MVIGCCGAGKSTLARKIHAMTEIPIFHLDQLYWKPNWEETAKKEWEPMVHELSNKEAWIIDGNYGSTMDQRIQRADTIIYLDFSTLQCLWRITKRIWKYHGRVRPDMTEECRERFDLGFYHYVATFNLLRRKPILKKLEQAKNNKKIHIFKNDKETERYLTSFI